MTEEPQAAGLAENVAREFAEGRLPATVERRLIREGYPEDEVKRLVEVERQRIEVERKMARSQAALTNAKIVSLVLVVVGIFLPWSIVEQIDLGLGLAPAGSGALNGISPEYFIYGIVFVALSILLLVLLLLTRTQYNPDNPRDRAVFMLTTLFEALAAGWWVFALVAAIRWLRGMQGDPLSTPRFGMGLFLILLGVLLMLVASYLEISAVGGRSRIKFKLTENKNPETGKS